MSKKLKTKINFVFKSNEIIYYLKLNARRLCILISIKQKILRFIYDENQHFDVYRCYKRITNIFYVFRFFKKIRKYIKYCF